MNLATVIGHATATVKHPSLNGWRMLVVQPLGADGGPDGEPVIAIDEFNSRLGSEVIITSDGKAVREAMHSDTSPVRWLVMGQPDDSVE